MAFSAPKDDAKALNSGQLAEKFACKYLKNNGLKIITTNHSTPRGELDIIARDKETIVFVEVRLRSKHHFGSAAESIDSRKQKSLIFAATHYLQSSGQWEKVACRFDAFCLTPAASCSDKKEQYQVEWIRNAFSIA